VDPGEHVLHFEHPDFVAADLRVTIHGGERGREVSITLWKRPSVASTGARASEPAPPRAPARGHRPLAYVFGIAGVSVLALGGGLALAGHLRESDLRSSCAPFCSQSDVDGVLALWWSGAGAAALGAIALGVGTYLWFAPRDVERGARAAR
jgi:hypothetical protein